MAGPHKPVVDNWYEDSEGQALQVITVDDKEGTVEVQYHEGNVEELDLEAWFELQPEPIAPPEDWSAHMDDETYEEEEDYDSAGLILDEDGWADMGDEADYDE